MKKRKIFLAFIILSISIFTYLAVSNSNSETQNNSNRTTHDTYVALGVFDNDTNLIDNGSKLDIEGNRILKHTIDIEQSLEEDREYVLIAMIDFKQVSFKIEDENYSHYKFKVDKSGEINLNVEIDIPNQSKELAYIILKEPDYYPREEMYMDIVPLQYVMTSRFNLTNDEVSNKIEYEDNVRYEYEGPYDDIWVSDQSEELSPIYSVNKGTKLYMTVGNDRSTDMEYGVVLFRDWNQTTFGNDSVKYFKVKSGEKQIFEFELPNANSNEIFQFVAFPRPYKVNHEDRDSTTSLGSFRFTVN